MLRHQMTVRGRIPSPKTIHELGMGADEVIEALASYYKDKQSVRWQKFFDAHRGAI